MSYRYARIDLAKTNYQPTVLWRWLDTKDADVRNQLDSVYRAWCVYKKFESVMPIFHAQYLDPIADVIGYYHDNQMVAWSLVRKWDQHNAFCELFAWTYHQPRLRLGIQTLKTECAIYKSKGYRYLYVDQASTYKNEIDGYEILGPMV
jgi:hypothetical protein